MLTFHQVARIVRSFNEEDNDVEVLSKAVDNLYEEM